MNSVREALNCLAKLSDVTSGSAVPTAVESSGCERIKPAFSSASSTESSSPTGIFRTSPKNCGRSPSELATVTLLRVSQSAGNGAANCSVVDAKPFFARSLIQRIWITVTNFVRSTVTFLRAASSQRMASAVSSSVTTVPLGMISEQRPGVRVAKITSVVRPTAD